MYSAMWNHFIHFPENCSMQKKGKINNNERTAKVCETEVNSRIDFGKLAFL